MHFMQPMHKSDATLHDSFQSWMQPPCARGSLTYTKFFRHSNGEGPEWAAVRPLRPTAVGHSSCAPPIADSGG